VRTDDDHLGHCRRHGDPRVIAQECHVHHPARDSGRTGPRSAAHGVRRGSGAGAGAGAVSGDGAGAGPPGIPGRVVNVAFLGNHTRITVATAVAEIVVVRPHGTRESSSDTSGAVGEEVCIWWLAEDTALIRD